MNNRTNDATGSTATVAACGANNVDMAGCGSPLLTVAAGAAVRDRPPSSRRENATAVHINGAAAGPSPPPPVVNHDNRSGPRSDTEPAPANRGDTVITGGDTEVADSVATAASDDPVPESTGAGAVAPPAPPPLTGATTDAGAGTSTAGLLGTSGS
jgi:hypothetical protein